MVLKSNWVTDDVFEADDANDISTQVNANTAKLESGSTTGLPFVVDEDDMASNSAFKVPTQQSVKAYVDTSYLLKANLASPTFTGTVGGITKSMVGLGNVDNTADTDKPVSTAQQTALDLKLNAADASVTNTRTPTDGTVTTAKFAASALVTAAEGLASSDNDTSVPTTAAVIDAVAAATIPGLTSSAAELNILDGATLSTTELNYVDGVTSAIQTQLNGKLSSGDASVTNTRTPTDGTVTTAKFAGSALVTAAEGLNSSDNDTSIPTTAAVIDAIAAVGAGGGLTLNPTADKTTNYTAAANDYVIVNATGTVVVTAPAAPGDGDPVAVYIRAGSSNVSFTANSGQELFYNGSAVTTFALQASGAATVGLSLWKYETTGAYWYLVNYTVLPSSNDIVDSGVAGRLVIQAEDEAELAALVGLEVGVDVQAFDADLAAFAALSPSNDDIVQRKSGAWTNRTMAQLKSDLALNNVTNNAQYYSGGTDVSVADGGTGRSTSTTAYGVLAAGTTATGAHQTISPGTSGHFLKSAGGSALAAFAAITQGDVASLTSDLAAKAPLASPTFTGTVSGVTKTHVGLGNVDNTSDATKWAATKTLTNTAFDANGTGNSIANIEVGDFAGTSIVTAAEGLASSDNDTSIPTTAAVIDAVAAASIPGLTASASELNILDGATLSTTELNYVDGVTSAIQTQLDDKVSSDEAYAVFNVAAYGAVGDGTTDDTTACRAALSAAISAGGGIVYFPAGTYEITPSGSPAIGLDVSGNNITLMGAGPYSSVIKKGGAGIAIDVSGTGSDYAGTMHLYSPTIVGLGIDSDYNSGIGVRAYYTSLMVMRDFALINNMDTGMDFAELWDSRFDNVRVITGGSETASQDKPAIWLRNSAAGSGFGLAGESSNQVHFRGLHLETNLTGGLWIEPGPGSSAAVESIFIDNIKVEQHQINHTPLVKVNTGLGISMNNIFIHAGEFRGGYSTPITAMDLSLEKSSVSNVFIGGSPTVTSIASAVNIHDSSRVKLSTIWGNYNASHGPTVAHLTWGANLTDIEYSNVWSNSGTQTSGTAPTTSLLGNSGGGGSELVVGSSNGTPTGKTLWTGTVAQYNAIGSKDANTVYVQTA